MSKLRDAAKYTAWRKRITRFQSSGLTVAAFCRREELSAACFHYWSRRIRAMGTTRDAVATVEAGADQLDSASARHPLVEFWLPESVRILVPAHCPEAISRVLRGVQVEYERSPGKAAFQRV